MSFAFALIISIAACVLAAAVEGLCAGRRVKSFFATRRTRVSFAGANYDRAKWIGRGVANESQMSLSVTKNPMHHP